MIYLDNAATTFPKPRSVIVALNKCVKEYCGNPGRSSHALSVKSDEKIYETRELIAGLIGADEAEGVVFTYNATYALNLALKTFITEPCHIICSDVEHNAVIRPLEKLRDSLNIDYSLFESGGDVVKSIKSLIRPNTRGIVSTLASNVTGKRINPELLSRVAKENNLFLILDASQAVGHCDINLKKTPCDVLCAPAHKALFGIQGAGFAYFKDKNRKESFIEGGSGFDSRDIYMPRLLPEAYEAGTLSTPAIVSLGAGVRFVSEISIPEIESKLNSMTLELIDRLRTVPGVSLYPSESGIVSFGYKGFPSGYVARALDNLGICTRGGLHCAPSAHKLLGTLDLGTVRISLSYLNTRRDIDRVYRAVSMLDI